MELGVDGLVSVVCSVRKLLLQLDSSLHPSVFDRVVAYDGGADEVMSYGGVTEETVRDLVHGAIFTRGPKELHHTAIFIGGTDMAIGQRLLSAVKKSFFGPLRVSVMLDSNGSNTTAVAAVARIQQAAGPIEGRRVVIVAGSGPVGMRAAGLLARGGALVAVTTRRAADGTLSERIRQRFGVTVREVTMADASGAAAALEGAEVFLSAGPPGVCLVPRDAWMGRAGLKVAADVNAVPPSGIEGIGAKDDGAPLAGTPGVGFGPLTIGNVKFKTQHRLLKMMREAEKPLVIDFKEAFRVAREIVG